MINNIRVSNFKSLKQTELNIGELNLFTGINGSGKSTFLQVLLLLRQSFLSGSLLKKKASLLLGGQNALVNLGTFGDVLCQAALKGEETIFFKVLFTHEDLEFESQEYNVDNRDLNIIAGAFRTLINDIEDYPLFNDRFQYLAAERIEPNEDYPRFQSTEQLGKRGEFTAHYLHKYGNENIPIEGLCLLGKSTSLSLLNQVNAWMGEISAAIEVITKENRGTNRIELSYRYKLVDGTPTQDQKPQNVGFGITHTLPVVVAILAARPGDIIIIENPETHLHPRGQSRLGQLFALAASHGVQLFIETHSDHIINGLRVAVKRGMINKDKMFVNYFFREDFHPTTIKRLNIDEEGGFEMWPEGFFDEWDNLLNQLL